MKSQMTLGLIVVILVAFGLFLKSTATPTFPDVTVTIRSPNGSYTSDKLYAPRKSRFPMLGYKLKSREMTFRDPNMDLGVSFREIAGGTKSGQFEVSVRVRDTAKATQVIDYQGKSLLIFETEGHQVFLQPSQTAK